MFRDLLLILFASVGTSVKLCRKEKFEYHHYQWKGCLKCDKCLTGQGRDQSKFVNFIPGKGATECSPCEPCGPGFFSRKEALRCRPCKVCSELNMIEVRSCSSERNAKCSTRSSLLKDDLVTNETMSTTTSYFNKSKQTEEDIETKANAYQQPITQGELLSVAATIGIIVAVIVVCLVFVAIFIYVWKKHRVKKNRRNPSLAKESRDSDNRDGSSSFLVDMPEDLGVNCTNASSLTTYNEWTENTTVVDTFQSNVKRQISIDGSETSYGFTHEYEETTPLFSDFRSSEQVFRKRPPLLRLFSLPTRFPPSSSLILNCQIVDDKFEDNDIFIDATPTSMPPKVDRIIKRQYSYPMDDTMNQYFDKVAATTENTLTSNYSRYEHSMKHLKSPIEPDLNVVIPFEELTYVSRALAGNNTLEDFALLGGVSKTDLSIVKHDYHNNVKEQAYQILMLWLHQSGSSATRANLHCILRKINQKSVVDDIVGRHINYDITP